MTPRILVFALAALACGAACADSSPGGPLNVEPSGPPEVRAATVEAHAEQFDAEVPERRAGSQQEQIAATYILGHLQQAGYSARLDSVPVGNLVNSTNVIATLPGTAEPAVVVAIAYDGGGATSASGRALGLFLELARAVTVADAQHRVEFAALGAENSDLEGGAHRGARELAELLEAQRRDVVVVVLGEVTAQGPVAGDGAASLLQEAGIRAGNPAGGLNRKASETSAVLTEAGYESAWVSGGATELGATLLDWLDG